MLTATVHQFQIELADIDRGVYDSLSLKVARHPSETGAYLWARLLAYCLEHTEGIAFAGDISSPEEPAIAVRDLTGAVQTWIEVGLPDAARLHRASKAAPRVAVYAHRDTDVWLRRLSGERIHNRQSLSIQALDPELLDGLAGRLERRLSLDLSVSDGHLCAVLGEHTFTGQVRRVVLE